MAAPANEQTSSEPLSTGVLRTLLLVDLVDSTKTVERLGDAGAAELFKQHDRLARDLLREFRGLEIDKTDGFLLIFEFPAAAIRYALAYHAILADLSRHLGVPLYGRAGIHTGEVILRQNTSDDVARGAKALEVEGLAKPLTARMASLASAKQTLLTRTAFDLGRAARLDEERDDDALRWIAHGPFVIKGVEEPVDVFEVGIAGVSPLAVPPDSEKAHRVVAEGDEVTLGWRPGPGLHIPKRPNWILQDKLNEGGFGEVWLAAHEKTKEQRAFKFCFEPEHLRALQREVTVFRLLKETLGNRDDIARVLDWEFDEAPYFLEAEYTEGGSILDWAEAQGGIQQVPLGIRLELVAQVADALAAAHSVGVLHKDVKPANVLVTTDSRGNPKARLTDFGIGLIQDQQLLLEKNITVANLTDVLTDTSSTAGTRLYLAPELLEGKVATVQADVYALGVVLYQAVVGDFRKALAAGWERDVDDELLREDIAATVDGSAIRRLGNARRVAERLRGLDARRTERAAERREREEAEASRVALEKAQKRRRVLGSVAAAATVVLLVVSVLAIQAVRARNDADRRRSQAEDLIEFMVGDLREKLEPIGRLDIMDDVGSQAMAYFASVPEANLTDDELFRRAQALYQIGEVRINQGNLPAAREAFEQSLALNRALADRARDDPQRLYGLGQAYYWVGFAHYRSDSLAQALSPFEEYLRISESLVARDSSNLDWQLELSYANSNIATVRQRQGDLDGALQGFMGVREANRRLIELDTENLDLQLDLADAHNAIGSVLRSQGKLGLALEEFRQEVQIKGDLVVRDPGNAFWRRRLATGHNFLGDAFHTTGELDSALVHFRRAVRLFEELVAADPTNASWRRGLAANQGRIAEVLLERGDASGALAESLRAETTMDELSASDPTDPRVKRDQARAYARVGVVLDRIGRAGAGLTKLWDARSILDSLLTENPDDLAARRFSGEAYTALGVILDGAGERDSAVVAWTNAVDRLAPVPGEADDARYISVRARALLYLDRVGEAEPLVAKLRSLGYRNAAFQTLLESKGLQGTFEGGRD